LGAAEFLKKTKLARGGRKEGLEKKKGLGDQAETWEISRDDIEGGRRRGLGGTGEAIGEGNGAISHSMCSSKTSLEGVKAGKALETPKPPEKS